MHFPFLLAILAASSLSSLAAVQVSASALSNKDETQLFTSHLKRGNFPALENVLGAHRRSYEADPQKADAWLKAFEFAEEGDPRLEPHFAAWVKQSSRSYVARFARGLHYYTMAWKVRGGDYIDEIPVARVQEMERLAKKASQDFEKSAMLIEKPLLSYYMLIRVGGMSGAPRARLRNWLDAANRVDPTNVLARRAYLLMLRPQWGGSIDEMRAFVEESKKAPMLEQNKRRLESDIWRAYARNERVNNNPKRAIDFYSKAIELYDRDAEIFYFRGMQYERIDENAKALADFDRGIQMDPSDAKLYAYRGYVLSNIARYDAAHSDLSRSLELDPSQGWAWRVRGYVHFKKNLHKEAIADYLKASDRGDNWAQHKLGVHYWQGKGVAQDRDQAVHWWKIAARNGSTEAVEDLRKAGVLP